MSAVCPYCQAAFPAELAGSGRKRLAGCPSCLSAYVVSNDGGAMSSETAIGGLDMRGAAPVDSLAGEVLRNLSPAIEDMPVFPDISQRVLALSRDPNASMNALADVIREDTVVAASVLRASNSALFRGLDEITTLTAACARLGLRTLCNIVQTVANERIFQTEDERIQRWLERLWRHSLVTAYSANEIAQLTSEPNPDVIYLTGLFHDVGKIALLLASERASEDAREAIEDSPELLSEILDNYHTIAGVHVMQQWNLPNEFASAVYYHHQPQSCLQVDWTRKLHIIALANAISTVSGFGSREEERQISLLTHPSAEYLGISEVRMADMSVDLEEKFEPLLEAFSARAAA